MSPGGELAPSKGVRQAAAACTSAIDTDGQSISLTAYTINGNNYFKLRDLGAAFDFDVSRDGASNAIFIDTTADYTAD